MKNFSRKIFFFFFLFLTCLTVAGQSDSDFFKSGGGFKINLPKIFTSSKELRFNDGKLSGHGKSYFWENPQEYNCHIDYYKLDNGKKSLTQIEKTSYLETHKKNFLKELQDKNLPFIEKKYLFNGNQGAEIQAINSAQNTKMLVRFFIVNQRFYFIGLIFNQKKIDDSQVFQILDSFALLDSKLLIAAKLEEAEPKPLPQEPVVPKPKTDAQDNNLKGKVKSVIEDNQNYPKGKRERFSEEYYNEAGNLVREISYDNGYPSNVTVWGYIDGNRVDNSNSVEFDDDQRPPREGLFATMESDENLPRDTRYSSRFSYKYNDQGQLIEKQDFGNNGQLWTRIVYNYKDNVREESRYGRDGSRWTHFFNVLDKDGNVIEEYYLDDKGKPKNKTFYTYEFDSQGNWILQKTIENKTLKGKTVAKILWTSYRTITYYP